MDILQKTMQKDPLRLVYEEPTYSPAEVYHEASKLNQATMKHFRRQMQRVLGQEYFLRRISQAYKSYPTVDSTALPKSGDIQQPCLAQSLRELITKRRSVREFSACCVSINQLSIILNNAYGITGRLLLPFNINQDLRVVPSAGALYPLELYSVCFQVEGLEPGIYHYNILESSLESLRPGLFRKEFGHAFFYEDMFQTVSVLIVIAGIPKRSSIKYGERGYRFMLMEAGHIGQNLILSATALDLGSLMLGGFMDDEVNRLFGFDGVQEFVLYSSVIGGVK